MNQPVQRPCLGHIHSCCNQRNTRPLRRALTRVRRFQKKWNQKPNWNRPFGTETEPEPTFWNRNRTGTDLMEPEPDRNRLFFSFLEPKPNRNRKKSFQIVSSVLNMLFCKFFLLFYSLLYVLNNICFFNKHHVPLMTIIK
jgi:hypothetical protein